MSMKECHIYHNTFAWLEVLKKLNNKECSKTWEIKIDVLFLFTNVYKAFIDWYQSIDQLMFDCDNPLFENFQPFYGWHMPNVEEKHFN